MMMIGRWWWWIGAWGVLATPKDKKPRWISSIDCLIIIAINYGLVKSHTTGERVAHESRLIIIKSLGDGGVTKTRKNYQSRPQSWRVITHPVGGPVKRVHTQLKGFLRDFPTWTQGSLRVCVTWKSPRVLIPTQWGHDDDATLSGAYHHHEANWRETNRFPFHQKILCM